LSAQRAAVLGDATGYYLGRRAGPVVFTRPDSRFFKREHLLRTKAFYEKHGGQDDYLTRDLSPSSVRLRRLWLAWGR